jgi:hypothetical protein
MRQADLQDTELRNGSFAEMATERGADGNQIIHLFPGLKVAKDSLPKVCENDESS